jgi:tetrahydromethanopterin S-methyltransferase subunit A
LEFIERFREQVTVIDLVDEGSPEVLRQAVCACYQEEPTPFGSYVLSDPGAYSEPPLSGKITWNVRNPSTEPKDEQARTRVGKARQLMERIKRSVEQRKRGEGQNACANAEE